MHILFILDYFPPYIGGIETLFDDVTQDLVKRGHEITVITSRHDRTLPYKSKDKWVRIIRVGRSRWSIIGASIWYAVRHRQFLQTVDHIHTSTFAASIGAWIVAKLFRKPITITIHEIYDMMRYHLKGRKAIFYRRFERIVCRLWRDHIIAVSNCTRQMIQDIHHVSDHKISTIYNQIDRTYWSRDTVDIADTIKIKKEYHLTDKKVLLFVGRLGLEKWLPYLIEVMCDVTQSDDMIRLVIIAPKTITSSTSPHLRHQIQSMHHTIRDNHLDDSIIWIDPVDNTDMMKVWMSIADVGVVPSMSEWFCYTAVQMQAMWLPLVVSKVWALPEVLRSDHVFVWYGDIGGLHDAIITSLGQNKPLLISEVQSIDYRAYEIIFVWSQE